MTSHININFEIMFVDRKRGIAHVCYWVDGFDRDRFPELVGPQAINVDAECVGYTDEQFYTCIAEKGIPIVQKQLDFLNVQQSGASMKYESITGRQLSAVVEILS